MWTRCLLATVTNQWCKMNVFSALCYRVTSLTPFCRRQDPPWQNHHQQLTQHSNQGWHWCTPLCSAPRLDSWPLSPRGNSKNSLCSLKGVHAWINHRQRPLLTAHTTAARLLQGWTRGEMSATHAEKTRHPEMPEIPLAESGNECPLKQPASAGGQLNTSQAG